MSVALGGNEYFLDRVVSGILTICSEQFVGVLTSVDCFAFGVEALLTSMEFFHLLTFLVLFTSKCPKPESEPTISLSL